jgi:hypothetical protein
MPYRNLNAQCIIDTNEQRCVRIAERFPDSGLSRGEAALLPVLENPLES